MTKERIMRIPILSDIHNDLKMGSKAGEIPFSKYPRPSLVRDSYICLNGEWKNNILVPFPLESANSGYKGHVPEEYTYERSFVLPKGFIKDKVLLHFDGVDCITDVYVNGSFVGGHEGGYNAFTLDITKAVSRTPGAQNSLRVVVTDKLSHQYPYGKQRKLRGGMWYTPVTGIWKSVWIESVTDDYITAIEITPSLTGIELNIESEANDYRIEVYDGQERILSERTPYDLVKIEIPRPHLWSPEDPHLYDIFISTPNDRVKSYFGLRTVAVGEVDGIPRILLNGEPYFFHGVLDQGYFPEGIYTPNCEQDFIDDIMRLKDLGINTIRKHIKVEPDCFYEACDRLGMIVFQDMVNNGTYKYFRDTIFPTLGYKRENDLNVHVSNDTMECFACGVKETLVELYNHPSIVYYTIFNEGWGQFNADFMYEWVRNMDPSRIIDATSGWFKQSLSDVDSQHIYFHVEKLVYTDKPLILSEFGGLSYRDPEHSYSKYINYGYGKCKSVEEVGKAIIKLYEDQVVPEIKNGLCGSIYTQAYDVEDETNGLYTYDRKVCKCDPAAMRELAKRLKIEKKQ